VILTGALAQPLQEALWLEPAAGVFLLLPRSERPGGSFADETAGLGAVPQPAHGDIRLGQGLGWQLCLIGPGAHRMKRKVGDRDREIEILRYAVVGLA